MTTTTLDGNPPASTLDGTEKIALIQNNSDKTATVDQVVDLVLDNATSTAQPNSLVKRDNSGAASFNLVNAADLNSNDIYVGNNANIAILKGILTNDVDVISNFQMNNKRIKGLPTPVNQDEAATKQYVDTHGGGGSYTASNGVKIVSNDIQADIPYLEQNINNFTQAISAPQVSSATANFDGIGGLTGSQVNVSGVVCDDGVLSVNNISTIVPNSDINLSPNGTGKINALKPLHLSGDPTDPMQAVTKQYADELASNLNTHPSVKAATLSSYPVVYDNGNAGVGATLSSTVNAPLVVDDYIAVFGDRILFKDQAFAYQNGVYVVLDPGSPATPWNAVRATDFDGSVPGEAAYGDLFPIEHGTVLGGAVWVNITPPPIVFGTTNFTFTQFFAAAQYTANNGVQKTGNNFSADLNYLNQNIQLDSSAQVTGLNTLLNQKLSLSGGTMSGILNMGSNLITQVTDPSSAQDAATKNYVDTHLVNYTAGNGVSISANEISVNLNYIENNVEAFQNNISVPGVFTDTISEKTLGNGVSIEGVNLLNGNINALSYIGDTTKYVVGANARYTTFSAAIAAAVSDGMSSINPKMIYIVPGTTLTENITLNDVFGLIVFSPGVTPDLRMSYADFIGNNYSNGARIIGNHTISYTVASSNNLLQFIGIDFSAPSGNIFTLTGEPGGGNLQVLDIKNCYINVPSTSFAFSVTRNMPINLKNSNVVGAGALYNPSSSTTSNGLLTIIDSSIYCTGQNVYAASSNINMRVLGSSFMLMQDATNAASYTFRAENSRHFGSLGTITGNTVVPHITGAGTSGSITYCNCDNGFSTTLNIANIGAPVVTYSESNTTYGVFIGNQSGYIVSGGRRLRLNTQVRAATLSPILKINDNFLISGASTFSGFEKISTQAALQTTTNVTTNIATVTLNEGESININGTINAAQSDFSNAIGGSFNATFRRAVGGVTTIVGTPSINVNSSSAAIFNVDTDGTALVRIRITGVTGAIYNWSCDYSYQKTLTNA